MNRSFGMKVSRRLLLAAAVCGVAFAGGFSLTASAVEPAPATMEIPLLDPWVPPAVRAKSAAAAQVTAGTLREQVEKKLKDGFDAADVQRSGALTIEQARAAGLGYIANNFEQIDRRKAGAVRFEDVKAFLKAKGAALD
jgi:hypothetical protein